MSLLSCHRGSPAWKSMPTELWRSPTLGPGRPDLSLGSSGFPGSLMYRVQEKGAHTQNTSNTSGMSLADTP